MRNNKEDSKTVSVNSVMDLAVSAVMTSSTEMNMVIVGRLNTISVTGAEQI